MSGYDAATDEWPGNIPWLANLFTALARNNFPFNLHQNPAPFARWNAPRGGAPNKLAG
jgi:hypothetical protein